MCPGKFESISVPQFCLTWNPLVLSRTLVVICSVFDATLKFGRRFCCMAFVIFTIKKSDFIVHSRHTQTKPVTTLLLKKPALKSSEQVLAQQIEEVKVKAENLGFC